MEIKQPDSLNKKRRYFTSLFFSLVVAGVVFLSLPRLAQAFAVPADVIGGPSQISSTIFDKIADAARWAWENGAAVAFKNAARTFTQRLAYDTAVMISSAGQGQKPLFSNFTIGQTFQRAADDAAGDFLDTLATQQTYVNLNICQPSSPSAQLVIGFTAFNEIQPRQPRCSLSTAINNWENFVRDPNILQNFGVVFDPRQNDLGIALQIQENLIRDRATASQVAALDLIRTAGWKDVTEDITGFIRTPASVVSDLQSSAINKSQEDFSVYTGNIVADALGVFTNTLASRLIKRFLLEGAVSSPSRLYSTQFGFLGLGGVEYATQINSSLSTPQLVGSTGTVDVISDLSNCPQDPAFYTPQYSCTITPKFAQALRKADEGSPLTVQEAIDQGFINGSLNFAVARTTDDLRSPTKAWYLSDIRKLRLARIVSVGWEFAAEKYAGSSVSLQKVIGTKSLNYTDGFNGAGPDKNCGTEDDTSETCGLIDPNWILRAPPAQCRTESYGQLLEPSGPGRQKLCVDYQHCIAEKADGSCQAWGYCKREENIWRFSGKSCEFPEGSGISPWPTCQTFRTASGATTSYLISSLSNYDDGVCSGAVSCRWYSAARSPNPTGQDDVYLPNKITAGTQNNINTVDFELTDTTLQPKFYLKNVADRPCSSKEEGCTGFLQLSNINTATLESLPVNPLPPGASYSDQVEKVVELVTDGATYSSYEQLASTSRVSMRQAPEYLNCYDASTTNDAPECANYLKICSKLDVGCELYTPRDGSPAVPGQVQANNVCPAQCNGFNTYQQTSSFFENFLTRPAPNNVEPTFNFIPASAQACSATYAGCEEFTNIEQNERKEYYTELRQCVRPEDNLHNTYYTWIGSDLTGYQLKTWQLRADDPNSALSGPYTTDNSGSGNLCGGTASDNQHADFGTNPDCKEFYITNGNTVATHYRYESKVVYASASCNRYRASSIAQSDCTNSGGTWETDNRCYYRAIPGQGKVCPASANSCREFRGPTAGNVRLVFPISTFGDVEPGVNADSSPLSGWEGGTNSNASTNAFGHSLSSGNDGVVSREVGNLINPGKQYTLSFWAKYDDGTPVGNGTSSLPLPLAGIFQVKNALAQNGVAYPWNININVTDTEWRIYNIGPITPPAGFSGSPDTVPLTLTNNSNDFFIDNIAFREVQDTFYIKKNTWVTPNTCLEPEHLRCSAYTTRDQQTVYLTGFSKICKNEAIGCRALIDTHNSTTPQEMQVAVDDDMTVQVPADNVVYRVYDTRKSCTAQFAGCKRLGSPNFDSSGAITGWSDVYTILKPDTFDPAVNQNASPLCTSEQNMCQVFTDSGGVPHYFKDPGNKVCEYKIVDSTVGYDWYKQGTTERCNLVTNPSFETLGPGSVVGDGYVDQFVGWQPITAGDQIEAVPSLNGPQYWGGTVLRLPASIDGIRTNISVVAAASVNKRIASYVRVWLPQNITAGTVSLTTRCHQIGTPENQLTTCPASFGQNSIDIGGTTPPDKETWLTLWQVTTTLPIYDKIYLQVAVSGLTDDIYIDQAQVVELPTSLNLLQLLETVQQPYAYLCPSNQSSCSAYSDPVLTKKSYYYLNDSNLDKGLCNGQVSEKEGCLLFNELSNSNKTYNAPATYAASQSQNNKLVAPSTNNPTDTNLVLKVRRDRVCAEWLSCQSASPSLNRQTGRYDNVCYSLGTCKQLGLNTDGSTSCVAWETPQIPAPRLTEGNYISRGISWSSQEYSGYSLANMYPIETLTQKEYGTPEASNVRLTHINQAQKTCDGALFNGTNGCNTIGAGCGGGLTCQFEDSGLTGSGPGVNLQDTGPKLCRAYPQQAAPFPDGVVRAYKAACTDTGCPGPGDATYVELASDKDTYFKDANVCQPGEICECSYRQLTYQDGTSLYYGLMTEKFPASYTTDISEDFNGNRTEILNRLKSQNINIGLKGYCLEKDPSRVVNAGGDADNACLTWLPIDSVSNEISIYDYSPEAGYQGGSTFYCSEARGKVNGSYIVNATQRNAYHYEGNSCADGGYSSGDFVIGGCVRNPWNPNTDGTNMCPPPATSCPTNIATNNHPNEGGAGIKVFVQPGDNEANLTVDDIVAIRVIALDSSKQWDWYDFQLTPANRVDPSPNGNGTITWKYSNVRGENYQNVHYFEVVFLESTRKISYYTLLTDDYTGSGNEGVGYNIKFYLKELCTEVAQVATAINNKAWTDRLLRLTDYKVEPDGDPLNGDPFGSLAELGFTSNKAPAPYGKTTLVTSPQDDQLLVVSDISSVTTPYVCNGTGCGGNNPGICISSNAKFGADCFDSTQCKADGIQGVCTGYLGQTPKLVTNTQGHNYPYVGIDRIHQLFATVYDVSRFNNPLPGQPYGVWANTGFVGNYDVSMGDWQSSGSQAEGGLVGGTPETQVPTAPFVRKINPDNLAEEGTEGITVFAKGVYYSDDASSAPIELNSSDAVQVMFYAYNPNGEQMPLRKVYVDWGDYSPLSGGYSSFKNHKANCKEPNESGYNWGDDPRACVENSSTGKGYFTFGHVYTCSEPGGCTYQPRVFVEDNWQWCAYDGYKCNGNENQPPTLTGFGWRTFGNLINVAQAPTGGTSYTANMIVQPVGTLSSCGNTGGPFSPTSQTYRITNTGTATLNWRIVKNQAWLTLSQSSGTLGPGGIVNIYASLNNGVANNLGEGTYSDTLNFFNDSTPNNNTTRIYQLRVLPAGQSCGQIQNQN